MEQCLTIDAAHCVRGPWLAIAAGARKNIMTKARAERMVDIRRWLYEFDMALTWTARYTAWNAAYDAERCRHYARQVEELADSLAAVWTHRLKQTSSL